METDILVAIIGLGGVIYASTIGYLIKKHKDNLQTAESTALAKNESLERQAFHKQVADPFYPVKPWTKFVRRVEDILETTEIDRLLVLVAVNGKYNPTHTSVIVDFRQIGDSYFYIDIPLDSDYIDRLLETKKKGRIRFKTSEVPGTLIGQIYAEEGVTEAVWAIIGKKKSFNTDQVAYKYLSAATHEAGGFKNPAEVERIVDSLVADFRSMLSVSGFGPV